MAALFAYMEEREVVRLQKDSGMAPPWTLDPIIAHNYFTNVMREDDRVSRWVQRHITDPNLEDPRLPAMLAAFRWLNHPPVVEWLMELDSWFLPGDSELEALDLIVEMLDVYDGQRFGGAYIISANGMRWGNWPTKHAYVLNGVVGDMVREGPMPLDSMEAFTVTLDDVPGWGGFMAYEVACDLRWAPGWLDTAPDIYTWANPGPGAARGLADVFALDRAPKAQRYRPMAVGMMLNLLEMAQEWPWGIPWRRPLEMRDIEHSLCEFNKYTRLQNGMGGKRLYPPRRK